MAKILLLLLITVHSVISMEIFLARMMLMVDTSPSTNKYLRFEKIGNTVGKNIISNYTCSCRESGLMQSLGNELHKKYVFGEDLNLNWINGLRLYDQEDFYGRMIIKYESNKYPEVNTPFKVCKDPLTKEDDKMTLARDIFFKIFVQRLEKFWDCVAEKNTVNVADKYYWELSKRGFTHCDVNASIRFEMKSKIVGNCGVTGGGAGETHIYNTLRVVFNVKFDDCDGKKWAPFKGLSPRILAQAKLEESLEVTQEISKNPIIL
ncbi:uncharacterized protein LOC127289202 isoform X1 [Leptopilina boulardi]|uniref:uncharacterized protein LOC127289202 isoform X1 n=1 Tax=Leptopilina boulardi TaxID=63433 RepID=UPI0021F5E6E4|nr:uncharacterized protein LOC127289202 isoform X1 [Leptopilina boulardi]